eukprot:GHVO01068729.1.p1 GENE.GHVO01068729.1~~GHVO01068729.1.p1  ORF type:complete len:233 (-),score=42.21 GHVO01068729.1:100-798(-)
MTDHKHYRYHFDFHKRKERKKQNPLPIQIFKCTHPGCTKIFSKAQYLRVHTRDVHASKVSHCPLCDKPCSRVGLYRHFKTFHADMKWTNTGPVPISVESESGSTTVDESQQSADESQQSEESHQQQQQQSEESHQQQSEESHQQQSEESQQQQSEESHQRQQKSHQRVDGQQSEESHQRVDATPKRKRRKLGRNQNVLSDRATCIWVDAVNAESPSISNEIEKSYSARSTNV